MGKKTSSFTVANILAALLTERTVTQAVLAAKLGLKSATVAQQLGELKEAGVPLTQRTAGRNVTWSVGKSWFPNAVLFEREEAGRLLLLLLRLKPSTQRDALIARIAEASSAPKVIERADRVAMAAQSAEQSEACRLAVEEAIVKKLAIELKYQKAEATEARWRTVSPQTVVNSERPYLVAWDHQEGLLKSYRIGRMHRVLTADGVAHREVEQALVEQHVRESMHGYNGGDLRVVSFVFNADAWASAKDNLPFEPESLEDVAGGTRVVVRTRAGNVLVRFLLAHGKNVTIETDAVREEVIALAKGAIAWHQKAVRRKNSSAKRATVAKRKPAVKRGRS